MSWQIRKPCETCGGLDTLDHYKNCNQTKAEPTGKFCSTNCCINKALYYYDQCEEHLVTPEPVELRENFKQYLLARTMRDDERGITYIARKLGYQNASSIQSLFQTYDWIYNWHAKEVASAKLEGISLAMTAVNHHTEHHDPVLIDMLLDTLKTAQAELKAKLIKE